MQRLILLGIMNDKSDCSTVTAARSSMDRPIPGHAAGKRRRTLAVAALVLGAVAASLIWSALSSNSKAMNATRSALWVGQVERGPFVHEIRAAGSLVPSVARWLTADTSVRVEKVLSPPGADVAADTVIVQLSNPSVVEAWRAAESALAVARAEFAVKEMDLKSKVADAESEALLAKMDRDLALTQERAEQYAVEKGAISRMQFMRTQAERRQKDQKAELLQNRFNMLRNVLPDQLRAARVRLEQSSVHTAAMKAKYDALAVRAGMAGVLNQLLVEEGMQLAAGANIARVAQKDSLVAWVKVPQHLANMLQPGQPARIELHGQVIAFEVARVLPAIKEGMVTTELLPKGSLPDGLRFDQPVDARIEIDRVADTLSIPRPDGAEPNRTIDMFRIARDGSSAERVQVQIGRASADRVEILRGLIPGDQVILSNTSAFKSADRLRLQ